MWQMKALCKDRDNALCKHKIGEKCEFDPACTMIPKTSFLFNVPLQITYKFHTTLAPGFAAPDLRGLLEMTILTPLPAQLS